MIDGPAQTNLGDATWTDFDAEEPPILLVPIGSCEQHGPHLPLDTDTRIAVAIAEPTQMVEGRSRRARLFAEKPHDLGVATVDHKFASRLPRRDQSNNDDQPRPLQHIVHLTTCIECLNILGIAHTPSSTS